MAYDSFLVYWTLLSTSLLISELSASVLCHPLNSSANQSSVNTQAYISLFSKVDANVANAVIGLDFWRHIWRDVILKLTLKVALKRQKYSM